MKNVLTNFRHFLEAEINVEEEENVSLLNRKIKIPLIASIHSADELEKFIRSSLLSVSNEILLPGSEIIKEFPQQYLDSFFFIESSCRKNSEMF